MAKIGPVDPRLVARLPGLSGRLLIRDNGRGTLIAQAWPKKRKRPLHPHTAEQSAKFGKIVRLTKYVHPDQFIAAMSLTKRTGLYPRDILVKAMFGKIVALHTPGERTKVPMSTIIQISALLDLIANQPGDRLKRGEDYWEPDTAGSGGGNWQYPIYDGWLDTITSTSAYAFKGSKFKANADMVISAGQACFTGVSGANYKMVICEIDGSGVIQAITESDVVQSADAYRYTRQFALAGTLSAGTDYAIMVGRTDGGNTYAFPNAYSSAISWHLPALNHQRAQCAKQLPVVGDTVHIADYYSHPIGINVS
jgi:hypothetical protein